MHGYSLLNLAAPENVKMKSVAAAGAHPVTAHEPAPGRSTGLQPALGVHVCNTVA